MLYVYLGCLAFGVAYAVLSVVFGAHGFDHSGVDQVDVGGHAGADHADVPSPFNPLVIASAITTFGAIGLIGKLGFHMGELASALVALGFAGGIGAGIFFGIVKFMYGSQSNSTFSEEDLAGIEAQIITPIPANGTGEITYVINGVRYNLSAKAVNHEQIARGETVIVREVSGHTAFVSPKITIDHYEMAELDENNKKKNKNNNE